MGRIRIRVFSWTGASWGHLDGRDFSDLDTFYLWLLRSAANAVKAFLPAILYYQMHVDIHRPAWHSFTS
jgi:hypothetical protein